MYPSSRPAATSGGLCLARAVAQQALVLAGGGGAYLAGQREEDRVECVAPEAPLEAHEQRAGAFLWGAGGVVAASLVALAVPASGSVGPDAAGPATAGRERREGRNRRGHDDD